MKTSIFCSHKEAVQFVRNSGYETKTIRRLLYDVGYTKDQLEKVVYISKSILDIRYCWKREEDKNLILSIIKQHAEEHLKDGPSSYTFIFNVSRDLRKVFGSERYPHIKDVIIREISEYLKDTINVPYDIY